MGVGLVLYRCPMHVCICIYTHAHTCMLNMINMDASMMVAICNFYTDNLILFEESLPLNTVELIQTIVVHPDTPPTCPTPRAKETQIGRITITFE